MRKNQKHLRLVQRRWFRVFYSGAYALWEIDFGRIGGHELVILLGCTDRLINWQHNKPIVIVPEEVIRMIFH